MEEGWEKFKFKRKRISTWVEVEVGLWAGGLKSDRIGFGRPRLGWLKVERGRLTSISGLWLISAVKSRCVAATALAEIRTIERRSRDRLSARAQRPTRPSLPLRGVRESAPVAEREHTWETLGTFPFARSWPRFLDDRHTKRMLLRRRVRAHIYTRAQFLRTHFRGLRFCKVKDRPEAREAVSPRLTVGWQVPWFTNRCLHFSCSHSLFIFFLIFNISVLFFQFSISFFVDRKWNRSIEMEKFKKKVLSR